jgi:biopolymer transport protein TolR
VIQFSQQRRRAAAGEVNLTPMIDIIFNLLIFFLIVAVISQKGLNLSLPKSSTAEKRPKHSLEIMVTRDERVLFDGATVPREQLEARLRQERNRAADGKADNIVLKADERAPFGLFVTVMDTARQVGLQNLVIATKLKPRSTYGGS